MKFTAPGRINALENRYTVQSTLYHHQIHLHQCATILSRKCLTDKHNRNHISVFLRLKQGEVTTVGKIAFGVARTLVNV